MSDPKPDTARDLALEVCRVILDVRRGRTPLERAATLAEEALLAEVMEYLAERGRRAAANVPGDAGPG